MTEAIDIATLDATPEPHKNCTADPVTIALAAIDWGERRRVTLADIPADMLLYIVRACAEIATEAERLTCDPDPLVIWCRPGSDWTVWTLEARPLFATVTMCRDTVTCSVRTVDSIADRKRGTWREIAL
jgi:hypothetical protein